MSGPPARSCSRPGGLTQTIEQASLFRPPFQAAQPRPDITVQDPADHGIEQRSQGPPGGRERITERDLGRPGRVGLEEPRPRELPEDEGSLLHRHRDRARRVESDEPNLHGQPGPGADPDANANGWLGGAGTEPHLTDEWVPSPAQGVVLGQGEEAVGACIDQDRVLDDGHTRLSLHLWRQPRRRARRLLREVTAVPSA